MSQAEQCSQMPAEQRGSCKKHLSIEAALNEVLTQDIWRQKRQSGTLCSNDAKLRCDRVARSFAVLCVLRLGCPLGQVLSTFAALQQAQRFIGTALGVLSTLHASDDVPFQGPGQGNGAGPTGWTAVGAPIINVFQATGCGATFVFALSCAIISFVCHAFINNVRLVRTQPGNDHAGWDLIPDMQEALDHWEGGLCTGRCPGAF